MNQNFYIYNNGQLHRNDNTLRFITEDGIKKDIPVERVEDIYVMGELTINTKLINFLSQYGINLHFLITIVFIVPHFILEKKRFQDHC
jgi:CRISPR-associated protein Cas1